MNITSMFIEGRVDMPSVIGWRLEVGTVVKQQ